MYPKVSTIFNKIQKNINLIENEKQLLKIISHKT